MTAWVEAALGRAQTFLRRRQASTGAFRFCLEANAITDANVLIAMALGGLEDETTRARLSGRLLATQRPEGFWLRFPGDEGDLSSTIESYLALRLAGHGEDEPELMRAERFIRAAGGLRQASSLTRVTLALAGQLAWEEVDSPPIELALAPKGAPVCLQDFASYTRVHLPPLMILAALRFSKRPRGIDLARLTGESRRPASWGARAHRALRGAERMLEGSWIRRRSLACCERFLLERQEPDGTLASYLLSTIFMVFAFEALGYRADHPRIRAAWNGLRGLIWDADGIFHQQPCSSTVWDTALSAFALLRSGAADDDPALLDAARYLLARESTEARDATPQEGPAGGWGFQDVNIFYPDVDDTALVIRVLRALHVEDASARDHAVERGLDWVLAMQNRDGGWAAFDHDGDKRWLEKLPLNDMIRAMTDPSSADMTGRTLELLGELGLRAGDSRVDRAVRWLVQDQRRDGSWFGRWGVTFIYGTYAALQGLAAAGFPANADGAVRRGVAWLQGVQNEDGGFGESPRSDMEGAYVPLGRSTPSQTAWAALALLATPAPPGRALERAIAWILERQRADGSWSEDDPTGSGFAGKIYLRYHSYRHVWPMIALAGYRDALRRSAGPRAEDALATSGGPSP